MTETGQNNLEVVISNDLTEIGRLALVVDEFVGRHQLPPQMAFELNLALDELLTNTISYGYQNGESHEIAVRAWIVDEMMIFEVEDDGRAFNPFDVKEPDIESTLDERPIGGLGIHLVRKMIDFVDYERITDRNIVTLRKKIVHP